MHVSKAGVDAFEFQGSTAHDVPGGAVGLFEGCIVQYLSGLLEEPLDAAGNGPFFDIGFHGERASKVTSSREDEADGVMDSNDHIPDGLALGLGVVHEAEGASPGELEFDPSWQEGFPGHGFSVGLWPRFASCWDPALLLVPVHHIPDGGL